jgi:hypothetical protein
MILQSVACMSASDMRDRKKEPGCRWRSSGLRHYLGARVTRLAWRMASDPKLEFHPDTMEAKAKEVSAKLTGQTARLADATI